MSSLSWNNVVVDVQPHFWSPKQRILHGVSMEVASAEIFGFLGPNGAGKTTSIKVALGLQRPTSGEVTILGGRIRDPGVRRRIGFMPERSYFPEHLTGSEVVRLHARLAGLSPHDAKARAESALDRAGLGAPRRQRLAKYSKGMLQRVAFAQAIVGDPELVILDEPMSGLDPMGRRHIRDLMLELRAEGRTVFFSTHILPDVEMVCDRVGILVRGTVRTVAPLPSLLASQGVAQVEITVPTCPPEARGRLRELSATVSDHATGTTVVVPDLENAQQAVDVLRAAGAHITELQTHRRTLEQVFLSEAGEPGDAAA